VRRLLWSWIAAISLAIAFGGAGGCGKGDASTPASNGTTGTPPSGNSAQLLHEKLHAGAYQLDSALDSLQQARAALNDIVAEQGGDTKEALLNVLDMLDSAGETLGQFNVSPDLAEIQKDVAEADKRRLHAIDEASDALREIREARATLADMLESGPPKKEKAALEKADDSMMEGLDAVADGIKLLGGTPPPEENSEPEPG